SHHAATTPSYALSLHDALPISSAGYLTLAHVDLRDRLGLIERSVEEEKATEGASIATVVQAVVDRGLLPQGTVVSPDSPQDLVEDRKSTRLNSSHVKISYAVFC